MIKKGIILAGGKGTRLSPLTKSTNKQLLPIYDKPLFFYPLSILMLSKIKDILMIVNKDQINSFSKILGDGSRLGIKITYAEQAKPNGIPEAFKIGKSFINKDSVALILGDNFFYGHGLSEKLNSVKNFNSGCEIFIKQVSNPENYGVVKIVNKKIIKIVEKPKKFLSTYAITGLYLFENSVIKNVKSLKPSKRNETEIVDLIKIYHNKKSLNYTEFGKGAIWSDAGKVEDLSNLNNFVRTVEKIQNLKIGCLEEISYQNKWISKQKVKKSIEFYGDCPYSNYLKKIIK